MADEIFEDPRLAAIYEALDPDRSDLDVYAAATLTAQGYVVKDIRGAPDRPGKEFVFFAQRPG